MSRVKLKASKMEFTAYTGLALLGPCPGIKNIETVVDGRIPILQDTKTSYTVKSTTSLLSIGKSAFEAIEPFQDNCFFEQTPSLRKVLSCVLAGTTTGSCQRGVARTVG
ncbi:hypothetical protein [Methylomonas sp. UP202]|uniref:hypothetical protein n=1 Tax=Methylomonas sp. UP202 TaxID=3040943 RepID=UPI0024799F56|nr:hypothetical protein [Methylomonas sp. UP202]WGS86805.1 hypothetical protein QC632_03360 [Methylomonas sp. UP202]